MRRLIGTLRARLLLSHLAVAAIGVIVSLVASRRLGSVFVDDHLQSVGDMMRGMAAGEARELEDGINDAFNRAYRHCVYSHCFDISHDIDPG